MPCSSSARRSARVAVVVAVVVGVLSSGGCRLDATVTVHAEPEGSGHVEVTVVLDRAAAERVPDLRIHTADLTGAGWEVRGPTPTEGGGRVVVARRPFRSPAEAERVLAEVTGGAVLRDFQLERDRSLLETRTLLTGVIDLREGVAAFSDAALAERLGGLPLGVDPAQLAPLDEALRVAVVGELPGGTARFEARPGEQVHVALDVDDWNRLSIAFGLAALLCAAAAALTVRRIRSLPRQ